MKRIYPLNNIEKIFNNTLKKVSENNRIAAKGGVASLGISAAVIDLSGQPKVDTFEASEISINEYESQAAVIPETDDEYESQAAVIPERDDEYNSERKRREQEEAEAMLLCTVNVVSDTALFVDATEDDAKTLDDEVMYDNIVTAEPDHSESYGEDSSYFDGLDSDFSNI